MLSKWDDLRGQQKKGDPTHGEGTCRRDGGTARGQSIVWGGNTLYFAPLYMLGLSQFASAKNSILGSQNSDPSRIRPLVRVSYLLHFHCAWISRSPAFDTYIYYHVEEQEYASFKRHFELNSIALQSSRMCAHTGLPNSTTFAIVLLACSPEYKLETLVSAALSPFPKVPLASFRYIYILSCQRERIYKF